MDDAELRSAIKLLRDDFTEIRERLIAVEIEQRRIREDILSGEPKERMQKRMLQNNPRNIKEFRKKIDKEINIKI